MVSATRRQMLEALGLGALAMRLTRGARAAAAQLVPGMRYVFFSGSASIPGSRYQVVPDGHGGFINTRTGQHISIEETSSASGGGFVAYDVQRVDESGALFAFTRTLLYDPAARDTKLIDCAGLLAPAAGLSDFWLPPAALRALAEGQSNGVQVARLAYPAAGETHDAICIATTTGAGWTQVTFDQNTGLLVAYSASTGGGAIPTVTPGGVIAPGAGTDYLAVSLLQKTRAISLPGPGSRLPDWFKAFRTLRFTGQTQTVVAGQAGPSGGVSLTFELQSGADYVQTRRTLTTPAGPSNDTAVFAANTVGSLWMDPAWLGGLAPGQPIDADDLLGLTIACAGPYETMTVVSMRTATTERLLGYDRKTGLLSAIDISETLAPAVLRTMLRLDRSG